MRATSSITLGLSSHTRCMYQLCVVFRYSFSLSDLLDRPTTYISQSGYFIWNLMHKMAAFEKRKHVLSSETP